MSSKSGKDWATQRGLTKFTVVQSKLSSSKACLVLIYPPGSDLGKRFPLERSEVVLGRGGDCDVQVDRDSVSRRHARVFRSRESWSVEDLQSTNGSYVNDVPVMKTVLRDGDFVKIGAAIFKFLMGTGIEAMISVGVACVEGEDIDVTSFIKLADENVDRAKREGRNRVVASTQSWAR